MLPSNAEEIAPRRWREGSGNPQFGYDVLHLKDAFQRYLGKGLPGAGAEKDGAQDSAQNDPKTSDTSAQPTLKPESGDIPKAYSRSDAGRMLERERAQRALKRSLEVRTRKLEGRSRINPTSAGASDGASDTEKHQQNEATPGIGVGRSDVSDGLGVSRASSAPEPPKPKGAGGRKKRKT
jgi:hypothetical protein